MIVGLKPSTAVLPVLALGLEATSMWEQRGDSLWLRDEYLPPKLEREKGSESRAGKRVSLGREMLCWNALVISDLSARFSSVKEAEPNGSTPRSRGKACFHLSSGTEEEMKRSRGRIRDLRMRLAGKRAERNLTKPMGIEPPVAPVLRSS
jgi:hypothetical protein